MITEHTRRLPKGWTNERNQGFYYINSFIRVVRLFVVLNVSAFRSFRRCKRELLSHAEVSNESLVSLTVSVLVSIYV